MIKNIKGFILSLLLILSIISCKTTNVSKNNTKTIENQTTTVVAPSVSDTNSSSSKEEKKVTESTNLKKDEKELKEDKEKSKETVSSSKTKGEDSSKTPVAEKDVKQSTNVKKIDTTKTVDAKKEEVKKVKEEKTSKKGNSKTTITKSPSSMFWTIKGKDKNGKDSTLYVLGTFHVGDNRIYPLEDDVEKAFTSSTRFVSEIASKDYLDMQSSAMGRVASSRVREEKIIKEKGKTYIDELSDVQRAFLVTLFGDEEIVQEHGYFEPWFLYNALTKVPILLSGLDMNKGLDLYLLSRLEREGKETIGLDTYDFQLDILEFGTREQQIQMVKDAIDELIVCSKDLQKYSRNLYEYYINANEKGFTKLINEELKEADEDYEKELNDLVINKRNAKWARNFESFLKEGGSTFIFAGCAHFVGKNSVFSYMKRNRVL